MKDLVDKLLKAGKITEEDIITFELLDPSMEEATTIAHSIWCTFDHNQECGWEAEAQIAEGPLWARPAHALWLSLAKKLFAMLGIDAGLFLISIGAVRRILAQESKETKQLLLLTLDPAKFWSALEETARAACGPELSSENVIGELQYLSDESWPPQKGPDSQEIELA